MILKALYGLRGSPRWFQDFLVDLLINVLHLIQYEADPMIFKSKDNGLHLNVHVDDPFATSRELDVLQNFWDTLG
eukprot:12084092-Alexandrium_andersonii.AAC.1